MVDVVAFLLCMDVVEVMVARMVQFFHQDPMNTIGFREASPEKNLFIFGHCQNRLDPPPCFLGHLRGTFFKPKKVPEKMFIMSNLKQKSASKVFGLGSTPPPPWKMSKSKQKKGASNNLDSGWAPPPFGQCPHRSRFFLGIASLRHTLLLLTKSLLEPGLGEMP